MILIVEKEDCVLAVDISEACIINIDNNVLEIVQPDYLEEIELEVPDLTNKEKRRIVEYLMKNREKNTVVDLDVLIEAIIEIGDEEREAVLEADV